MLWNQYEILKFLDPQGKSNYLKNQEILDYGYEQFYPELNLGVMINATPAAISQEVMDILDVFRAIHLSCVHNNYTPKSPYAKFEGFDGNHETEQFAVARFLRTTQGLWPELAGCPDNSHGARLEKYRAMLFKWKSLGGGYQMTGLEIEAVANAV